ncbi:hypothetical protein ABMA27_013565 [Loxostege sticticalis]|uniref:Reverse transcriptase domain-containing protein n=1 Tax=Loxostege sticticalis TaxID=481309 RepID=A0ABR3IFT7_LOXSC
MDEDSLRRICETAFTSEEITSAKKLLYDSIPTDKRLKTRKGGKKTRRDIDDIISLLKQTDPDVVPTFVARDLQKLPPITFDHIDVTRLLKDLLILKESVNGIREQYVPTKTFAVIAREVEELKFVLKTDNYVNVNTRRGNYAQNRCEYDSGPIGLDYMSQFSPNNKINNQPLENTEHKLDMSVHSYYEQQNVTHSINGRSNSNATSIPRMLSPNEAGGTDELSSGVHANPPIPISLATILAKVLDSVLNKHLNQHINLNDAQFGFRPGLSTESAILCLKNTVQYYTGRNTPVYAWFLDLSKAFDLVSYNVLWNKLYSTALPNEITNIFKYWYENQTNMVKWAGEYSKLYKNNCGVRQGGLTSPTLFNIYVNGLIGELSGAGVGCSIDGCFVNNISYADDMVLLSPSVNALKTLIAICERYAVAHGLRYNVKKSEILVFKSGTKTYSVPPLTLSGTPLQTVKKFKYLGHWVTEDLKDDLDLERERRALSVRGNMLSRRFAFSALRVQYNNALRGLLGLPWRCSASGMFAACRCDGFGAVLRKRVASLWGRVRGSTNSLLKVIADRPDSLIHAHWMSVHVRTNKYFQLN